MIINMNGAKAPETPSSVLQEKTVTPETLPTVIGPDEGYDGLSQVTVNPDSQLKAENIRSGKTIFGVSGTFQGDGNKTEFEVKYLTAKAGIENDYTITGNELKAFVSKGVNFNGYPYDIMSWSRFGTLDLSDNRTSPRPASIVGLGYEYMYPVNVKLSIFPGSSSTGTSCVFQKSCIGKLEITEPTYGFKSAGGVFYQCYFYEDVVIPEGIEQIDGTLIEDCAKNKTKGSYDPAPLTLTLPSTFRYISSSGKIHFKSGYEGTLILKSTTPPTLSYSECIRYVAKIIVPQGTLATYRSATNWSSFASIMEEAA